MPDVLEAPLVVATLDDGARTHTSSFRLVSFPFATRRGGLSFTKSMSGGVDIPTRGGLRLSTSHATSHHPHYGLEENPSLVHRSGHPRDLLSHPQNRHFRHKSSTPATVRCFSINHKMRANERWVLFNKEAFQEIFDATLHEMTRTPGDYLDKDGDVDDRPPSPVTPECHYMPHKTEVGNGSLSAAISRAYRKQFSDQMQADPGEACIPEGTNVLRQMSPPCQENQGMVAAPPMESAKTNALCDITNDHHGHQRYTSSNASTSSTSSTPSPGPTSPVITSSATRGLRSPQSPLSSTVVMPTQQLQQPPEQQQQQQVPDRENEPLDLSNKHSPLRDASRERAEWSQNSQQVSSGEQVLSWNPARQRLSGRDEKCSSSPHSCSSSDSNCSVSGTGNTLLAPSSPPRPVTPGGEGLRQSVKVSVSANHVTNERGGAIEVKQQRGDGEVTDHARSSANGSPSSSSCTTTTPPPPPPPSSVDRSSTALQTSPREGAAAAAGDGADEPAPDDPRALGGVGGGREGCSGALANASPLPLLPSTRSPSPALVGTANSTTTTSTTSTTTTAQQACCSTTAAATTTASTTITQTSGTSKPSTDSAEGLSEKVSPGSVAGGGAIAACGSASSSNSGGGTIVSQVDRGGNNNSNSSGSSSSAQKDPCSPDNKQLPPRRGEDKNTLEEDTSLERDSRDSITGPGGSDQPPTGGGEGGTGATATSRCEGGIVGSLCSSTSTSKLVSSTGGKVSTDSTMATPAPSTPSVHHHHHHHRRISVGGGGVGGGGAVKQASENWAPLNKATVYNLVEEVMISLGESAPEESNSKYNHKNKSQTSGDTQTGKACAADSRSSVVNKMTSSSSGGNSSVNNNYVIKNCVALSTPKSTHSSSVLNPSHVDVVSGHNSASRDSVCGGSNQRQSGSTLERGHIPSPQGLEEQGVGQKEGVALGSQRGSRTKCQLRDHLSARSQYRASRANDAPLPSDGNKPHHFVSQHGAKRKHDEVVGAGGNHEGGNRLEVLTSSNRGGGPCGAPGVGPAGVQAHQARRSPLSTSNSENSSTSPTSKVKQQCWVALNKMVVFDIVDSAMRKSEDEESLPPSSGDKHTSDDNKGEEEVIRSGCSDNSDIAPADGPTGKDGERTQVSMEAGSKAPPTSTSSSSSSSVVGCHSYLGSKDNSDKPGDNNRSSASQAGSGCGGRVKSDLISQDFSSGRHDHNPAANNNIQYKNKFSNNSNLVKKRQCDVALEECREGHISKRRRSESLPIASTYPGPPSPHKACVGDAAAHPVRSTLDLPASTKSNSLEGLLSDSCKDLRPNGSISRRQSGGEVRHVSCSESGRMLVTTSSGVCSQAGEEVPGSGSKHLGPSQARAIDRGSPSEKFTPVNLEREKAVHAWAPVVIRSPCRMSENNQFAPNDAHQKGASAKLRPDAARGSGASVRGTSTTTTSGSCTTGAQESQVDSFTNGLVRHGVVTMTSGTGARDARSSPRLGWVAVSKIDVHNIVDSVVDSMIAGEIGTSQPPHHGVASGGEIGLSHSPNASGASNSPLPSSSSTTSSPLPSRKMRSPVGSPLPAHEAEGCQAASPPHPPSSQGAKSPRTESSSDRATPSPIPASPCSPPSPVEHSDKSFDAKMTKAFKWKSSLLMRVEEEKIDVTPDVLTSSDSTTHSRTNAGTGKAGRESKSESRNLRSGRRSSRKGAPSSVTKLK